MIPVNRTDILDTALELLETFASQTQIRGRFVSLYLGLRRMGSDMPDILSSEVMQASNIEGFLDDMYTKTHRAAPYVVLSAVFGGSTSPNAPYSTRSGVLAPGRKYPTNTWRNNFGVQKGIGCPASSTTIQGMLENPVMRISCPHMQEDTEGRYLCGLSGTVYRGEEHAIWLRIAQEGYQKVDLNNPVVYKSYLSPNGRRIPLFPLIGALYCLAPIDVYSGLATIGIPDFASDFYFSLEEVQEIFDTDPESPLNAAMLAQIDAGPSLSRPLQKVRISKLSLPETVPLPSPLPLPSPSTEINSGVAAELAVAQDLQLRGWNVAYRGNQRAFGYDLEASRKSEVLRIEVKSSVAFTSPELTEAEWKAAQKYGEGYILAVVDFVKSETQSIWYVRNPAASVVPTEKAVVVYRFPRQELIALRTDAEFL